MPPHGKDKAGPLRDDEIKKRMQGELRAEWAPDTELVGGTPPGMTSDDVELRAELARYLGRGLFPADRAAVLETLRRNNAPDRLTDLAGQLPEDGTYRNVQDIARALGLGVEDHRT
jgi:hypothetical protein